MPMCASASSHILYTFIHHVNKNEIIKIQYLWNVVRGLYQPFLSCRDGTEYSKTWGSHMFNTFLFENQWD